jgi:hypothetical protein
MLTRLLLTGVFVIVALGYSVSSVCIADGLIQHALNVELHPIAHRLKIVDQISLPAHHPKDSIFYLHRGLQPRSSTPGVKIKRIKQNKAALFETFKLSLPTDISRFSMTYEGVLYHPLEGYGKEQARGFRSTPGTISEQGVYLSGGTYWYPEFDSATRLAFTLSVKAPDGWKAVSQGGYHSTDAGERWNSPQPQEEIYLIAAPFTEYTKKTTGSTAMVFLREPDQALASKYLDAADRYIKMYEELIGTYPYEKFALVENFWETGFGMPSFTLLGSRVIRLPFILNSSYPHEILHNWWGNGVYVDYAMGNWSEGLTAYLADHLIKEQQAQGADYRQKSLQKYTDYAVKGRDFPLSEFHGRHSSASEAVGYGKALMLFHMLRRRLGDNVFTQALRTFYQQFQFKKASYEDLRKTFETVSMQSLETEFDQWTQRAGAPALSLSDIQTKKTSRGYRLRFHLEQTQEGDVYHLRVPLAVTMQGQAKALQQDIEMKSQRQDYAIDLPAKPLRVDIDPEFDVFRTLAREETPPAFTELFGSQNMLVVLPSKADKILRPAYEAFAADLQRMGPDNVLIKYDSEIASLPQDQVVTLVGWRNRFYQEFATAIQNYDVALSDGSMEIAGEIVKNDALSVALITRRLEGKKSPISFIASALPEALPGLGRKLPHYHKYSYLAFTGAEPENQLKGRWPVIHSPMTGLLEERVESAKLAQRPALISAPAEFDVQRMMETIGFLSDEKLKGRGFGSQGLDSAADYIAQQFKQAGLSPGGDEGQFFQTWRETGGEPPQGAMLKNIIGVIPAANANEKTESIVIGAHYDHLGLGWPDVHAENRGKIHPGADDNASGVAVLLELARSLNRKTQTDRHIVFVAFSGEEAGRLGSKHYLNVQKHQYGKNTLAMINLDTVGRLGDNKVMVLGGHSASEWPHIFNGIGYVTGIPIENITQPLDSSDQISFHEAGIPAVQLFSGANLDYHKPSDNAGNIDEKGLVKIATVVKEAIAYFASKDAMLTSNLQPGHSDKKAIKKQRKVSLGSIPDFTYSGEGYRLSGVTPESPAAHCGLKKGDVIVKISGTQIRGLNDVSDILKSMHVGDKMNLVYQRDSVRMDCETFLKAR